MKLKWAAGEISPHAGSEKEAKAIAAEYLQSDEHMQVQLMERNNHAEITKL